MTSPSRVCNEMLRVVGVDAVASQVGPEGSRRSLETLQPLAERLGLQVSVVGDRSFVCRSGSVPIWSSGGGASSPTVVTRCCRNRTRRPRVSTPTRRSYAQSALGRKGMAMSPTGQRRLQVLAAGLLTLDGGLAILYAGMRPFPPFSDVPVFLPWQVFGIVELAAAVGIFLGRTWGRALGVGVIAVDLALFVFRLQASNPAGMAATVLLGVLPSLFVLWVLIRRW